MAMPTRDTPVQPATYGSLSQLVADHHETDRWAAQALWEHCFQGLIQQAQQRLDPDGGRCARAEDVAREAFLVICTQLACTDTDHSRTGPLMRARLWRFLARLTARVALHGHAPQTGPSAAQRGTQGADPRLAPLSGRVAPPEFTAAVGTLLGRLHDPSLRTIAVRRFRGFTPAEIARELDGSISAVDRKLAIIAALWSDSEDSA